MSLDRQAVNFDGKVAINPDEATLPIAKKKTDRGRIIDDFQFGNPLFQRWVERAARPFSGFVGYVRTTHHRTYRDKSH
jgi:hypothetical protein